MCVFQQPLSLAVLACRLSICPQHGHRCGQEVLPPDGCGLLRPPRQGGQAARRPQPQGQRSRCRCCVHCCTTTRSACLAHKGTHRPSVSQPVYPHAASSPFAGARVRRHQVCAGCTGGPLRCDCGGQLRPGGPRRGAVPEGELLDDWLFCWPSFKVCRSVLLGWLANGQTAAQ